MIYIKNLKKNEKLKLEAVEVLPGGKEVMLPHITLGNFCIMPMAKTIDQHDHPNPDKMADMLLKWYTRTTDSYSEGIYSFARKGHTKRGADNSFYRYIKREIDSITERSSIKGEYEELECCAREMWTLGYEQYKDTFFWSYNLLHGDLHTGNVVSFRGNYRLIDWENLRSGPKEIELAFYLCWDYLRWGDTYRSLDDLIDEISVFVDKRLISAQERDRILYFLIPMWMLILVLYLNNGNLLYEEDRKAACQRIIPLYKQTIFESRPWKEMSNNG